MAPFVFEGAVLPSVGADERGVRECPVCPPWVECAHFGDQVVRLVTVETFKRYPEKCYGGERLGYLQPPVVSGPGRLMLDVRVENCACWDGVDFAFDAIAERYPTEAEARREFERRCELMRQEAE